MVFVNKDHPKSLWVQNEGLTQNLPLRAGGVLDTEAVCELIAHAVCHLLLQQKASTLRQ